jgi:hypothetical protein
MPAYKNIQKARNDAHKLNLQKSVINTAKLSSKMKNYENNIESEDLDEEATDDRSNYERNQDLNLISNQIRKQVYKLFANDNAESDTFMDFINQNNISVQDFNTIYPELLKNSDPYTNTANQLIPKFKQLLENDYATGSDATLQKIYTLIKGVVDDGNMEEEKAGDLVDFMEAKAKGKDKNFMSQVKNTLQKNIDDIKKVTEFNKLFRTPEKQKEVITNNKGDDYDTVEGKSEIAKYTAKELKQILVDYNNEHKIDPTFKKISLSGAKAKLVDKVWDLTY